MFSSKTQENPFEISDDTAYERCKYSHHNIVKYSKVTEVIRSKEGNQTIKGIHIDVDPVKQFEVRRIFENFLIIGLNSISFEGDSNYEEPKI